MAASSAGRRTAPLFLRLPEPAAENAVDLQARRITRSAPAAKCPHGDDGWGEFARSADPAADQRQGRPKDCTAPSFSSHHEAACSDLEEKQEPRVASSAEAKKGNGMK